jgi:hypothetical protein
MIRSHSTGAHSIKNHESGSAPSGGKSRGRNLSKSLPQSDSSWSGNSSGGTGHCGSDTRVGRRLADDLLIEKGADPFHGPKQILVARTQEILLVQVSLP